MKKKLKILCIIIIILMISIILYLNSKKETIINNNDSIESINCILNKKKYKYDVYYNSQTRMYYINKDNNLITDLSYNNENTIRNLIIAIFENKGATCQIEQNNEIMLVME